MTHVTVMSGPERRRRWSADQRREILMAAFSGGTTVSDVSRRYDVATSLIYKWRHELFAAQDGPGFLPAVTVDGADTLAQAARSEPAIVVELSGGARVSITASASATLVTAALRALR